MCACKLIDYTNLKTESSTGFVLVTWKIKHALCCCVGKDLRSPPFEFNKTEWELRFDPSRHRDSNTFVTIKVVRGTGADSDDTDEDDTGSDRIIDVVFKIGLSDSKGQLHYTYESRKKFECYDEFGPDDGIMRRVELESKRNELMPRDILTVCCEIWNGDSASRKQETTVCNTSTARTHIDMLLSDIELLLKERKNCDVTLHIGKEEFHAHRTILGARSPVFAAMFEHDLLENNTNSVTIQDIPPSAFSVTLDYMYTGRVQELSIEQAIGVYAVADKYDLKGLKSHCRVVLLDRLSVEWFFEIAMLADAHSDGKMMDGTKLFARDNVQPLLSSDKCDDFFQNHPRIALEILRSASSGFKTKA